MMAVILVRAQTGAFEIASPRLSYQNYTLMSLNRVQGGRHYDGAMFFPLVHFVADLLSSTDANFGLIETRDQQSTKTAWFTFR